MTKSTDLSVSVGDYLKALWIQAQGENVSTGDLAAHLEVSPPSVTGMLSKLQRLGLVTHERYRGASLTPAGRSEALRLIRRHRLIETFLIEYLDYAWEEVHHEAERLEHAMSDSFTERLAQKLGQPLVDPHGDPIPQADGTVPERPSTPLVEVPVGSSLEVNRVRSQEAEVLQYVTQLGIRPGTTLVVSAREPLGGLIQLNLSGMERAVSRELASLIEGRIVS